MRARASALDAVGRGPVRGVHYGLVVLLATVVAGCTRSTPAVAPPPDEPPAQATVEPGSPGSAAPQAGRSRRRMNIEQLDASIRRATGGVGWDVGGVNQFDLFGPTLGRPDYVERTREELEPSTIFQKFLDDAARAVCARLVTEERGRAAAARVLFVSVSPGRKDTSGVTDAAVDENLRAALLRFHGRKVEVGAPELEGWRFLYQSSLKVSSDAEKAWQTVCVGLFTHPDFYTY